MENSFLETGMGGDKMLTNLDFLSPGQQWPPKSEVDRLQTYDANRKLFEGKHDQVYKNWIRLLRKDQQATMEIILNWHKRLSTLWADLLLGEPPRITAGDKDSAEQQAVERIIKDNALLNAGYEVAIDVSRFGTGLFKVRYNGRAIIEGQTPTVWFPIVAPDNVKDVQAHVLAWSYDELKPGFFGNKKVNYLKYEIHERGKITSALYTLDNGVIGQKIDETVQNTGVNEFLVVPINNLLTTDRVTGMDDYNDLDSIIQELEVRVGQISRILDKHADPSMYGPEDLMEIDFETGRRTFKAGGEYYPVPQGEEKPGYIVWDGQLESSFKQIELLMEQLYFLSETSPAAFGQLKSGLAESGSALRRLMMAALAKVNRIRMRFDPALKKVLQLASQLEKAQNMPDAIELDTISIDWQDGLPRDDSEVIANEAQRYSAGLSSLESSLRRIDGLEGEALQQEVDRIKSEQPPVPEAPKITLNPPNKDFGAQ
jgi:hypothetical protein